MKSGRWQIGKVGVSHRFRQPLRLFSVDCMDSNYTPEAVIVTNSEMGKRVEADELGCLSGIGRTLLHLFPRRTRRGVENCFSCPRRTRRGAENCFFCPRRTRRGAENCFFVGEGRGGARRTAFCPQTDVGEAWVLGRGWGRAGAGRVCGYLSQMQVWRGVQSNWGGMVMERPVMWLPVTSSFFHWAGSVDLTRLPSVPRKAAAGQAALPALSRR